MNIKKLNERLSNLLEDTVDMEAKLMDFLTDNGFEEQMAGDVAKMVKDDTDQRIEIKFLDDSILVDQYIKGKERTEIVNKEPRKMSNKTLELDIKNDIQFQQAINELKKLINNTLSEAKWGSYAEYSLPNGDRDDEVEETKVYRQGKTIDGKKWTETILDEKTVNILGKDITYIKVFHKTENADPDNFTQKDRYTWEVKNKDDLNDIEELLKSSVKSQLGVDDSKLVGASTMIGVPQSIEG